MMYWWQPQRLSIAFLNAENKRSEALCKRIGMVRDGCLRENRLLNGRYYDDYVYSILEYEIRKEI